VDKLNSILHEYADYIIGRMGIPYRKRKLSIISIVLDAPHDVISALSGKLGMLPDVSAKAVYSKTLSSAASDSKTNDSDLGKG
jgi:putative iron-only hydrogenase system regulator